MSQFFSFVICYLVGYYIIWPYLLDNKDWK